MSFFDEARHARNSHTSIQSSRTVQSKEVARQFITNELSDVQDIMHRELRKCALEKFRNTGQIEEITYGHRWTLSWEIKNCDTTIVKNYLRIQAKKAFGRLSAEIGGEERLIEYLRGGMPPYGGRTDGLGIYAEHQDYYDDG